MIRDWIAGMPAANRSADALPAQDCASLETVKAARACPTSSVWRRRGNYWAQPAVLRFDSSPKSTAADCRPPSGAMRPISRATPPRSKCATYSSAFCRRVSV